MKVLGFAASNSKTSINKKLVETAFNFFENVETEVIDLNDYEMPIFSMEREKENGHPQQAHDFLQKIKDSDAIIISFAEYNRSISPAFKNIVDWASRIERQVFQGKPVLLMSTTPGGAFGSTVLQHAEVFIPHLGAAVAGSYFLPFFNENFAEGKIINEEKNTELQEVIKNFQMTFQV